MAKEHRAVEARAAKERWAVEVKAWEEESCRAQAEAIRQQKAREVASGSGTVLKGALKVVGALEKGKVVEQSSCDHCVVQGVTCEVSSVSLTFCSELMFFFF